MTSRAMMKVGARSQAIDSGRSDNGVGSPQVRQVANPGGHGPNGI
jgi:hypothetical protein